LKKTQSDCRKGNIQEKNFTPPKKVGGASIGPAHKVKNVGGSWGLLLMTLIFSYFSL